jgi:tetratricopeptide (TPR) repeat protein
MNESAGGAVARERSGARARRRKGLALSAVQWLLISVPAQTAVSEPAAAPVASVQRTASPAQHRIDTALRALEARQASPTYNELAMAYAQRARETGDTTYYSRAEEAVAKSLALASDDFEARKIRVWILLGHHDFARARDEALILNKRAPDDVQVYGLLADAHAELGEYDAAEAAVQWMLDLRGGNVAALTRAAYLRELFGDIEGALDFFGMAYVQTPETETEERAWILTQVSHLHLLSGAVAAADAAVSQALTTFPGYHYALGQLAKVRLAQGRSGDAVTLLEQRHLVAPHAENLFALAEAREKAGQLREARNDFGEFERAARAEMNGSDNANRELVFYYVDHASKPAEALRIATIEMARRGDIYTRDAYAWALAANGRREEARAQVAMVLSVGVQDPALRRRARMIAK